MTTAVLHTNLGDIRVELFDNHAPKTVALAATEATTDKDGYVFINGRRVRMISTKGKTLPRRTRPAVAAAASISTRVTAANRRNRGHRSFDRPVSAPTTIRVTATICRAAAITENLPVMTSTSG